MKFYQPLFTIHLHLTLNIIATLVTKSEQQKDYYMDKSAQQYNSNIGKSSQQHNSNIGKSGKQRNFNIGKEDLSYSNYLKKQSLNEESKSNNTRNSDSTIPNIVHYIWYATEEKPLKFHHMLGIFSAHKILQPDVIYFHTNLPPTGKYWNWLLKIPNFVVNFRQPPTSLYGEPIKTPMFYTSHSNVDRVKILMESGGIYLDMDVIVVRPFHQLRQKYPCVIGQEQDTKACGSLIICHKSSVFLRLWINSYLDDYRIEEWAYNSGQVPYNLAKRFTDLVHMDPNRINRPNFDELHLLWGPDTFEWRNNYAVHTWYRLWKTRSVYYNGMEPDEDNIKAWNSTFGQIARSILYGSPGIMTRDVDGFSLI